MHLRFRWSARLGGFTGSRSHATEDTTKEEHKLIGTRPTGLDTIGTVMVGHLRTVTLCLATATGIAGAFYVPSLVGSRPWIEEVVGVHAKARLLRERQPPYSFRTSSRGITTINMILDDKSINVHLNVRPLPTSPYLYKSQQACPTPSSSPSTARI